MAKDEAQNLAEILASLETTSALGKTMERAQIWERWPELAGRGLAPHGHPVGFRKKHPEVLVVAAESPVWVHRFTLRKWDLVRRINRMAGRAMVSDIFFVHAGDEGPLLPTDSSVDAPTT